MCLVTTIIAFMGCGHVQVLHLPSTNPRCGEVVLQLIWKTREEKHSRCFICRHPGTPAPTTQKARLKLCLREGRIWLDNGEVFDMEPRLANGMRPRSNHEGVPMIDIAEPVDLPIIFFPEVQKTPDGVLYYPPDLGRHDVRVRKLKVERSVWACYLRRKQAWDAHRPGAPFTYSLGDSDNIGGTVSILQPLEPLNPNLNPPDEVPHARRECGICLGRFRDARYIPERTSPEPTEKLASLTVTPETSFSSPDPSAPLDDADKSDSEDLCDSNPVALPCKHIFGSLCIATWLSQYAQNAPRDRQQPTCPMCRYRYQISVLPYSEFWRDTFYLPRQVFEPPRRRNPPRRNVPMMVQDPAPQARVDRLRELAEHPAPYGFL